MSEFESKIIPINDNSMRQPTMLEIAELIMMSNANIIAMTQVLMVNRDIMSEEQELDDSLADLSTTSNSLIQWWYALLKEQEKPHE